MRAGRIAIDIGPLRQFPDFRRLFTGRFFGMAGNAVMMTTANWQVYRMTQSSLAVGLVALAASAGNFGGLLAGGMLADRHDRRTLLVAFRLPQSLLAAVLVVNSVLPHPLLGAVYALVLVIGALGGLSSPAATAAVPALVGTERLAAAAALNATASQLGSLGGPALAGILIAGSGRAVGYGYGLAAACFATFGLAVVRVRPLPPTVRAQRPGLRSLVEGIKYVRHNGVVGGMLLVDTSAMLFGMPTALFPALAATRFHGGSTTYGLLVAAPGLGALIGAATSGWTSRLRRPGVVVIAAGLVWGAAIVGFGFTASLPLGLACLALAGAGDLVSEVLRNALLQHYTPDPLRGRVSSLYLAQVTTTPALGNVEAGAVAQLVSPAFSVISGGLACVAGALALGALNPALRRASFAGLTAEAGRADAGPSDAGPAQEPTPA